MTGFSGSYASEDVTFLLKQVQARELSVEEKEAHIQRNGGHYSEVLTPEKAPSAEYLALFEQQLTRLAPRVAQDVYRLSQEIHARRPAGPIVVVSLARAGTPYGVLVHRTLAQLFGRESKHYCVSIFRDKGLDLNALHYLCQQHEPESLVFVDGWTGKGVIGRELRKSVEGYNAQHGTRVDASLHVVADIAGTAEVSASREDYLLPSAVLNAVVSGLVSRTVLSPECGPQDFHGCAMLTHLAPYDQSRHFVDTVWSLLPAAASLPLLVAGDDVDAAQLQSMLSHYMQEHNLASINLVKPGVGEATRVLLRRKPLLLVLRDEADPHVAHLMHLANALKVRVDIDYALPCRALALISSPD